MPKKPQKDEATKLLKGVGERIIRTMAQKNITQADMGTYLGISQAAVSAWRNEGSDPGCDKIIKIANKLGVSVEYLLIGTTTAESLNRPAINYELFDIVQSQQETISKLMENNTKLVENNNELVENNTKLVDNHISSSEIAHKKNAKKS